MQLEYNTRVPCVHDREASVEAGKCLTSKLTNLIPPIEAIKAGSNQRKEVNILYFDKLVCSWLIELLLII